MENNIKMVYQNKTFKVYHGEKEVITTDDPFDAVTTYLRTISENK